MDIASKPTPGQTCVVFQKERDLCTVVLNRPAVMNAIGGDMVMDLRKVFQAIEADEKIRVVILEGSGEISPAEGTLISWVQEDPPRNTWQS